MPRGYNDNIIFQVKGRRNNSTVKFTLNVYSGFWIITASGRYAPTRLLNDKVKYKLHNKTIIICATIVQMLDHDFLRET